MNSRILASVIFVLACSVGGTASAQMASAPSMAASGAKMKATPRARVTGGPGYVSESTGTAPSSASSAPMTMKKHKVRVTGGPGGTAGTPDTTPGK